MQRDEARRRARHTARAFEQALDPVRRKRLGQFFTGVPLGKLLAHLALQSDTRTVLDPMVGHGDLLDATCEAAADRGYSIARLDGIEVDKATADTCRDRLAALIPKTSAPDYSILAADAFDPTTPDALPVPSYDLVITNPPYVRYQTRNGNDAATDLARAGLEQIVDSRHRGAGGAIWKVLAQSYSGLADLSVPASILAGSLVRPGGRLALVLPATWRSRDYADVIRYLLLRCFALETIVADTQPGWFSDALVRTHLIIARRLIAAEARQCLSGRERWPEARWLHVAPDAADQRSLVGSAFEGEHPEADFAAYVRASAADAARGIEARVFDLHHEWVTLHARISRRHWYSILEGGSSDLPLFSTHQKSALLALPEVLRDMLPTAAATAKLVPLEGAGIKVGQGLRTGCNGFFYVTTCGTAGDGSEQVNASLALGGTTFTVPSDALHPVLRRQAEMQIVQRGEVPPGRVLDLRGWVLPEDSRIVADARSAYEQHRRNRPRVMPATLTAFVRHAATVSLEGSASNKPIPELSAVRSNVRQPGRKGVIPRFWYMLPDFTPRHLPAAFVARVNQGTPWVECNTDPPLLIDANFSTFWTADGDWTRFALKALLNSVWCRAFMEVAGTPLGGGALKLEATHLRQMPVPVLAIEARSTLDAAGRKLTRDSEDVQADIDRIILQALLPCTMPEASLLELAHRMAKQTSALCAARQRVAS
ncbi:MAG: N-6 DNA methylase [Deltaproteobacteria bacterium]|nr:N-6 DNA methylase [Deltaproteobacteria bacterium]